MQRWAVRLPPALCLHHTWATRFNYRRRFSNYKSYLGGSPPASALSFSHIDIHIALNLKRWLRGANHRPMDKVDYRHRHWRRVSIHKSDSAERRQETAGRSGLGVRLWRSNAEMQATHLKI